MTRRALGRGRLLLVIGSLVALVGLIPAWWFVERTDLRPLTGNGFQGIGIVIFLGALAMVALVTLPFASRDGKSDLDRPSAYVLVGVAIIGAFLWRLFEISQSSGLQLPMQAPGVWVTGVGLLIVAWGLGDILTERPRDY
jgi:cation transport ATPase